MAEDVIFTPLKIGKQFETKNRIFRSSISGKFDNYDGSGPTQARINWEERFARGGVGAIITSYVPVASHGRILTNYAMIDRDERIEDWARLIRQIHTYDCRFIIQLSHSGRQRDDEGIDNHLRRVIGKTKARSSTSSREPVHGFSCQAATKAEIRDLVTAFGEGARRAKAAGADGVETHSANGYLFTQFLSSGINDRGDEYGGSLVNRARFLMEVMQAIRTKVGNDFHFQVKISAVDRNNAVWPFEKPGNVLQDSIQVCKWVKNPVEWAQAEGQTKAVEEDLAGWKDVQGADAIHVSSGSSFPHPLNPPGEMPIETLARTYEAVVSTGELTFRNEFLFHYPWGRWLFKALWDRIKKAHPGYHLKLLRHSKEPSQDMQRRLRAYQGVSLGDARQIREEVNIPVICTGGFQQASYIRKAISDGYCDAVSIARPLIANNDLVEYFRSGHDLPPRPCTYCNNCLVHAIKDPLGCYEIARFDGDYERMMQEVYSVYQPVHRNYP
jgi:2,4-dienoyl-CoA reductase-like NADH-dependent reductase (Old Yellow Enzyme family)